ncbi:MAG: hypothetical protein AAB834_06495 [Patescibacteria group bacterium]
MNTLSSGGQETRPNTFPLQDVHVWMRHAEAEHQVLLARAEELEDDDPELLEIERRLAETPDMSWNLTSQGIAQAACIGLWKAKYLLTPGWDEARPTEPIVPNGTFDGGYTSPANRTEQTGAISLLTAKAVLGRSAIKLDGNGHPRMPIDLRLREINLGEATSMTKRAYRQKHPDNIARRIVDPLFTGYKSGANIPEHMDLVIRSLYTTLSRDMPNIRSLHTTLGRDTAEGSRSALMSTHGRTVRAAALTIRRDHPRDFPRIERTEEIKNGTLFITRRTPDSPRGFNQFAIVNPWLEQDGEIVLNDTPPNFIDFIAPSSRSYEELLHGLPAPVVTKLLAQRPRPNQP